MITVYKAFNMVWCLWHRHSEVIVGINHNPHCDIDLIDYKHLNLSIVMVFSN